MGVDRCIDQLGANIPAGLVEVRKLGGTVKRQSSGIWPSSTALESLKATQEPSTPRRGQFRAVALSFRNLAHYIAHSLLES